MKRVSIKAVILCAGNDFLKWLLNSRMIILAALAVFIYICSVRPLLDNSELMGKPLNVLEPYIAALNSGLLMLIIPLGFLAVSSDFPKLDRSSMFVVVRTGRANWFFGQVLNLLMMSAAYLLFIFIAGMAPIALRGFWGTDWSEVAIYFPVMFPEQSENFGALLLPKNLFNHLSLLGAAVQSTLFVFIYLILLGVIMMCFTVLGKKSAGIIICGGLIAAGSALCSIGAKLMWALPMANSVVWLHYTEFRRKPFYPIWCSWLYFGIIIAFFLIFAFIMLKRSDCFISAAEGV